MIVGIGTDIVRIDRVQALHARYGERFARRVLGPDELREYARRRAKTAAGAGDAAAEARAVRYIAKRFAAKEAFSKAIGLGLRGPMTLLSLQILNDAKGRPHAHPRKALAGWLAERGWRAHVSISDEIDAALAFVVIEQGPPAPTDTNPSPDTNP